MPGKLSFGQTESILAALCNVHPAKRAAFQSRLKQWQKMEFPEGVNVGRGVKAGYGADQLFQLVYMIELLRVGLTPDRAIDVVTAAWPAIRESITETIHCLAGGADHLHYLALQIDSLTSLQEPEADHMHVYCRRMIDKHIGMAAFLGFGDSIPEDERPEYLAFRQDTLDKIARSIILETDSLVIRVWSAMLNVDISPSELRDDFMAWRSAVDDQKEEAKLLPPPPDNGATVPVAEDDDDERAVDWSQHARSVLGFKSIEDVWAGTPVTHAEEPFLLAQGGSDGGDE